MFRIVEAGDDVPGMFLRDKLFESELCHSLLEHRTVVLVPPLSAGETTLCIKLLDSLPKGQDGVGRRGKPELSSLLHILVLVNKIKT